MTDERATALNPSLRQRARAGRGWLIAAGIAIAAVVIGVLIGGNAAAQKPELDPTSSAPSGAKALVTVLRDHGVDVRTAATLNAADAAAHGVAADDLTGAIYDPSGYLDAARLVNDDHLDTRTVLIAPTDEMAEHLSAAGRDVAVIASATTLQNEHIVEGSNAGTAIRALGGTPVLIWYTPSPADSTTSSPPTIADLMPPWVSAVIVLGFLTALTAMVWRGRRFGPLVVEDLPVVVRASESLEGRARLYQRSDARLHALDALRMGAIARLTHVLGLGPSADVADVAAAAAERSGRPPAEVRTLLLDAIPRDDADFLELAREVAQLEASVLSFSDHDNAHDS